MAGLPGPAGQGFASEVSEDNIDIDSSIDESSVGSGSPQAQAAPGRLGQVPVRVIPPLRLPEKGTSDASAAAAISGVVDAHMAQRRSYSESDFDDDEEDDEDDEAGKPRAATVAQEVPPRQDQRQESGPRHGAGAKPESRAADRVHAQRQPAPPRVTGTGSAPELRVPRSRSAPSEPSGDYEMTPGGQEQGHPEAGQEVPGMRSVSYSWRDTLHHFPSLIRLYPLAASSEGTLASNPPNEMAAEEAYVASGHLEGNDEYLNGPLKEPSHSEAMVDPNRQGSEQDPLAATTKAQEKSRDAAAVSVGQGSTPCTPARNGYPCVRGQVATPYSAPARSAQAAACQTATASSAITRRPPEPVWPEGDLMAEYHEASPHSMLDGWAGHSAGASRWYTPDGETHDISASWAEIEQARRDLDERARGLARREAAVRRAEARSRATAERLAELRRRLDDYGEELEEGVMRLTAEQNALREERRQTMELQARARRMCAAAVRDDVVGSKMRGWDWARSAAAKGGV